MRKEDQEPFAWGGTAAPSSAMAVESVRWKEEVVLERRQRGVGWRGCTEESDCGCAGDLEECDGGDKLVPGAARVWAIT